LYVGQEADQERRPCFIAFPASERTRKLTVALTTMGNYVIVKSLCNVIMSSCTLLKAG